MMSKAKTDRINLADDRTGSWKKTLWEYVQAIGLAVILALFIRTFVIEPFEIPSGSMTNTLLIGDRILVNKFIYGVKLPFTDKVIIPVRDIERHDVVVFEFPLDPETDFIKRVVGLPGDTIEVRDKQIFVNGQLQKEPFTRHTDAKIIPAGVQPRDYLGPIVVPPGKLFVMGDNRDQSYDSRFWGFVDQAKVKGKAFVIYWSWNARKWSLRWGRLLQWIN